MITCYLVPWTTEKLEEIAQLRKAINDKQKEIDKLPEKQELSKKICSKS